MRREALLAVEIGVALLSMSLVMERRGTTLADGETARIQPLCRHVADRLRELQRHYPKGAAASTEAACAPPWAPDDAAPAPHVALMSEELLAINRWLDDLHALLQQHGVNRA